MNRLARAKDGSGVHAYTHACQCAGAFERERERVKVLRKQGCFALVRYLAPTNRISEGGKLRPFVNFFLDSDDQPLRSHMTKRHQNIRAAFRVFVTSERAREEGGPHRASTLTRPCEYPQKACLTGCSAVGLGPWHSLESCID